MQKLFQQISIVHLCAEYAPYARTGSLAEAVIGSR